MFHVPNQFRIREGQYGSTDKYGNNGLFAVPIRPTDDSMFFVLFKVIASDGEGWEHVSVSLELRAPSWSEMCQIKDLFWDKEDTVIQYHPAASQYVNIHPHCLHLWRPIGVDFPTPPTILV